MASQVTIHVYDEGRGISRDFRCDAATLLSRMRYFKTYVQGNADKGHDVEISVHCDSEVFAWLLNHTLNSQQSKSGNAPNHGLTVDRVLAVLISSNFLQMDELVRECLAFIAANLLAVAQQQPDLVALPGNLLSQLAKVVTEEALEQVMESSAGDPQSPEMQVLSRLYKYKLESLLKDMKTTVVRCSRCTDLFSATQRSQLCCSGKHAQQHSSSGAASSRSAASSQGPSPQLHELDNSWRLQDYLQQLRQQQAASWRDIYWHVWGIVNVLYCQHCLHYFPAAALQHCSFHPEPPIYAAGRPCGRYPCCGGVATRSGVVNHFTEGCCSREHMVLPSAGSPTSLPAEMAAAYRQLKRFQHLATATPGLHTGPSNSSCDEDRPSRRPSISSVGSGARTGSSWGSATGRSGPSLLASSSRAGCGPGSGGGSSILHRSSSLASGQPSLVDSVRVALQSTTLSNGGISGSGAPRAYSAHHHSGSCVSPRGPQGVRPVQSVTSVKALGAGAGSKAAAALQQQQQQEAGEELGSDSYPSQLDQRLQPPPPPTALAAPISSSNAAGASQGPPVRPIVPLLRTISGLGLAAPPPHAHDATAAATMSTHSYHSGADCSGAAERAVPLSSLLPSSFESAGDSRGGGRRRLRLELLHEDDMARMDALIHHLSKCRPSKKAAGPQEAGPLPRPFKPSPGGSGLQPSRPPSTPRSRAVGLSNLGRKPSGR